MNGEWRGGPGACAPIHVLACASPAPDIRGTDQCAVTAVTFPTHTYPAMCPNEVSAPARCAEPPPQLAALSPIATAAATTPSHRATTRIESSPPVRPSGIVDGGRAQPAGCIGSVTPGGA